MQILMFLMKRNPNSLSELILLCDEVRLKNTNVLALTQHLKKKVGDMLIILDFVLLFSGVLV